LPALPPAFAVDFFGAVVLFAVDFPVVDFFVVDFFVVDFLVVDFVVAVFFATAFSLVAFFLAAAGGNLSPKPLCHVHGQPVPASANGADHQLLPKPC
jgi:hypothetical protein